MDKLSEYPLCAIFNVLLKDKSVRYYNTGSAFLSTLIHVTPAVSSSSEHETG